MKTNWGLIYLIFFMISGSVSASEEGLILYWSFDENQGCNITDSVSGINGGIMPRCPTDSAKWAEGKKGSALYFDGNDDYIIAENSKTLRPENAFTISVWINMTGHVKGNNCIISNVGGVDNSGGYNICVIENDNIFYQYYVGGFGTKV